MQACIKCFTTRDSGAVTLAGTAKARSEDNAHALQYTSDNNRVCSFNCSNSVQAATGFKVHMHFCSYKRGLGQFTASPSTQNLKPSSHIKYILSTAPAQAGQFRKAS